MEHLRNVTMMQENREWRLGGKLDKFSFGGKCMLLSSRVWGTLGAQVCSQVMHMIENTNVPK